MGKYEIDLPELIYYVAPVLAHIVLSLTALLIKLKYRRTTFFATTVIAILGIVGVSFIVKLNANHEERFAESLIAVALLTCFNLWLVILGPYKATQRR